MPNVTPALLVFYAPGRPMPKGSPSIMRTRRGRPFVRESAACIAWQAVVASAAEAAILEQGKRLAWLKLLPWKPLDRPVALELAFYLPERKRERIARDAGELLRALAGAAVKPDLDKLTRAVLDALAGIVYVDDSRVVQITARKLRLPRGDGRPGGAEVRVVLT